MSFRLDETSVQRGQGIRLPRKPSKSTLIDPSLQAHFRTGTLVLGDEGEEAKSAVGGRLSKSAVPRNSGASTIVGLR